jgi:hypothetical protein
MMMVSRRIHSYLWWSVEDEVLTVDTVSLPADFLVWAGSAEADFLGSKYVFASWDVEELKGKRAEIEKGLDLTVGLTGLGA